MRFKNPHSGEVTGNTSDMYNYDEEGERLAAEWYDDQCALHNRARPNFPRDGDSAMVTDFGTVPVPPNKSAFDKHSDDRLARSAFDIPADDSLIQHARSSGGEGVAPPNIVM